MKRKNFFVLSAGALAIIGAGTIAFNATTQSVMAAEFGKVEKVPTSYQVASALTSAQPEAGVKKEAGAKKGGEKGVNYHLSMDDLNTDKPTKADLPMKEAAKIGEQYLSDIFGLDMKGAYVYMTYCPYCSENESLGQAFWAGDVLFQKKQTPEATRWTFMIDAVTGELFNIGYGRQLDEEVPLDMDVDLMKDYSVYEKLARENVEKFGLMDSPIDRVEYNCQGYSGNDPDIAVDVIGKNGEVVNMTFSRYDQTLLGITTNRFLKITTAALDNAVGEVEKYKAEYKVQ